MALETLQKDWGDIVNSEPYQQARPQERLSAFNNFYNHHSENLKKQVAEAPEDQRPALQDALTSFEGWGSERLNKLSSKYTLGGRINALGGDLDAVRGLLSDPQTLQAQGFEPEEISSARRQVFEENKELFRSAVRAQNVAGEALDMTLGGRPGVALQRVVGSIALGQPPAEVNGGLDDRTLEEKFFTEPGVTDLIKSQAARTATAAVSVTLRWLSGIGDLTDRFQRLNESVYDDEAATRDTFLRSASESMTEQAKAIDKMAPLDPRIGENTAAFMEGAAQMPGQIAPWLVPGVGPALGVASSVGQVYQEGLEQLTEDYLFDAYKTEEESGRLVAGQTFDQWKKTLSDRERDEIKGLAAGNAMVTAVPNAALDIVADRLLLGKLATPGLKMFGKTIAQARRSAPVVAQGGLLAAKAGVNMLVEGGTETLQGANLDLNSALVRQDFAGGRRDPSLDDPEARPLSLAGRAFSNWKYNFLAGMGGAAVTAPMTAMQVGQEQASWDSARSMVEETGPAYEEARKALDAMKATVGEDSPWYARYEKGFRNQQDEAHWTLWKLGDPAADTTRAEKVENRRKAGEAFQTQFAQYLSTTGASYEDSRTVSSSLNQKIEGIRDTYSKLREAYRAGGFTQAAKALEGAEKAAQERAKKEAAKRQQEAQNALDKFVGSAAKPGEGRAPYARAVLTQAFPDFAFSPDFNNDDVVVGVLDAFEGGALREGDNVQDWLSGSGQTAAAPSAAPVEATDLNQGGVNTNGQQENQTAQSQEPGTTAAVPTPSGTEQGTGQGVAPGDGDGDGDGDGTSASPAPAPEPEITIARPDGTQAQMTRTGFLQAYNSLYDEILGLGTLTPENVDNVLNGARALEQIADQAPELSTEQKAEWKKPVEGLRAYLEGEKAKLQPGESVAVRNPEAAETDAPNQGQTAEGPATSLDQTIADQTPVRLGSQVGVLTRDPDTGRPVFKADDDTEIELRVREEAADKAPEAWTPADFGTETDAVEILGVDGKRFSVLPQREAPPVRPVFVRNEQPQGGETNNELRQETQSQSGQAQEVSATNATTTPPTPAPAPAPPLQNTADLVAAAEGAVKSVPDAHRQTDGRRKLVSRELAVVLMNRVNQEATANEGKITRKRVLEIGKELGATNLQALALAETAASPEAISNALRGDYDGAIGLFEAARPAANAEADADTDTDTDTDTDPRTPGAVTPGQSANERWVNDAFSALEAAVRALPNSAKNRAIKQQMSTEEGRSEVQRKLGGIYSVSLDGSLKANGVLDPVVREETLERILRGEDSQTNPGTLTRNVLGDLLNNLDTTGDPFTVETKDGEKAAYSARAVYRRELAPALQAQNRRDRELPTNDGEQRTEDDRKLNRGMVLDADPERSAAKSELAEMKIQATRESAEEVADELAAELDVETQEARLVLAKILQDTFPNLGVDAVSMGWRSPEEKVRAKQTALRKLKGREREVVERLVTRLRSRLEAVTEYAREEGLLGSEAVVQIDDVTLADILTRQLAAEGELAEARTAATKARETGSLAPLEPLLAKIGQSEVLSATVARAVAMTSLDGRATTNSRTLAQLTPQDMQRVLESPYLPDSLREVLQAAMEVGGGDPLAYIAKQGPQWAKDLASLIEEQNAKHPQSRGELFWNLGLVPKLGTAQGLWIPGSQQAQVSLFLDPDLRAATVLHEKMHSIWDWKMQVYRRDPGSTLLTTTEREALDELVGLKATVETAALERIAEAEARGDSPEAIARMRRDLLGGFNNSQISLEEFLNEAINHKPFQDFLAELTDPNAKDKTSVWRKVVNAILRLMRGNAVALDSVLQRSFELSLNLAKDSRETGLDIKSRNTLQIEFFRDNEARLGRSMTPEEIDLASRMFEMAYPKSAAPATIEEAMESAPDVLLPEELNAFNSYLEARESARTTLLAAEFVSPNDSPNNLSFDEAMASLSGGKQSDLKKFIADINQAFSLTDSKVSDALGDWADGAEPTTLTEHFASDISYEDVKVMAALKGAFANQKAVIPFRVNPKGTAFLYDFLIPGTDSARARDIVAKAGIEFRTLIEQNEGIRVLVFDEDGSTYDTFANLITDNEYKAQFYNGFGEFLGSWTTREEGKEIYTRTVAAEVARLGSAGRDLGLGSADSLRAAGIRRLARAAGLDIRESAGTILPTPETTNENYRRNQSALQTAAQGLEAGRPDIQVARPNAEPNPFVQEGVSAYNARFGLREVIRGHYAPLDEARAKQIAEAYEALPVFDASPETQAAYEQLASEIQQQWDFAEKELGVVFEAWTKEGQPYANSREMVRDVRDNKHLWFFIGGEPHPLLNKPDENGLTMNDKLRAIHDLFGHAAEDYQFGPRGEENAWIKHSQMFTPLAQRALTTETRGQNSWVNFGPQNYSPDGARLDISAADRPFAKQKVSLLPEEFMDWESALFRESAGTSQIAATVEAEPFDNSNDVKDYIRRKFLRTAEALSTQVFPNFGGHTARYVVSGPSGGNMIEYNPRALVGMTPAQVDAIMREELIHAASARALQRRKMDWVDFYTDLGRSMSKPQKAALKKVYTSARKDYEIGAEYFRVSIQKLLYGTITEAEMKETAMQKIIALLKDVVAYFQSRKLSPEVRDIYNTTVAMLRKADAKNIAKPARVRESAATVTPQQDQDYLAAVESGDMETAQRMVDEAARAAGYTPNKLYHGSAFEFDQFLKEKLGSITMVPSADEGFFFTTRQRTSEWFRDLARERSWFERHDAKDKELAVKRAESQILWNQSQLEKEKARERPSEDLIKLYENGVEAEKANLAQAQKDFDAAPKVKPTIYEAYLSLKNPLVHDYKGKVKREKSYKELLTKAKEEGRDGVILKNTYDSGERDKIDAFFKGRLKEPEDIYVVFEPNQIKLADPVTRDAQGNVIPLSQRFNEASPDIRESAAISFGKAEGQIFKSIANEFVAEAPRGNFMTDVAGARAALRQLVFDQNNQSPTARGGRKVNMVSPDEVSARKLAKATGQRWDNERALLEARVIHALTNKDRTTTKPDKVRTAALVPETLRYADVVSEFDMVTENEGRVPFIAFSKLYQDPESPTGQRWHTVEFHKNRMAFETQYSSPRLDGRVAQAVVVGLGDSTPKNKTSAGAGRGLNQTSGVETGAASFTLPDVSPNQGQANIDSTTGGNVQNNFEAALRLEDEADRLQQQADNAAASGDYAVAAGLQARAEQARAKSEELAARMSAPTVQVGFQPLTFGPESRKVTQALARVREEAEYAPIEAALGQKTYMAWTEEATLRKAEEFIDSRGGDLQRSVFEADKAPGVPYEQVIAIKALAAKRAQSAANAARAEVEKLPAQIANVSDEAVKARLYKKLGALRTLQEHYQGIAVAISDDLMTRASAAGSELRAFRLMADIMAPASWVRLYKAAIVKAQVKRLSNDGLVQDIGTELNAARVAASNRTARRMQKALASFARGFMPPDATPAEVEAAEKVAAELASPLPVREAVVRAAVEDVVVQGVETLRRTMSPEQQADPSFLEAWEKRLRETAFEQINAALESRMQGGRVNAEIAPAKTDEQVMAEQRERQLDMWRTLGDLPLAETVFNLAKEQFAAAGGTYASILDSANFSAERASRLKKAVKMSINIAEEIRKTSLERGVTEEILAARIAELNPELSESDLRNLSDAVIKVYNAEVNEAAQAALNRIVSHSKNPRAKRVLSRNTVEDLLPLVNMGAFSTEEVFNVLADKFGLPTWNPEIAADFESKAVALQALPEGSLQRLEAAQQLQLEIAKANIKASRGGERFQHFNQLASSLWTSLILSAPPTQIVNAGMSAVSVLAESFFDAAGFYAAARRRGASHQAAQKFFLDGMVNAWRFAAGKDAANVSRRAIEEAFTALTKGTQKFKSSKFEELSAFEMFKFDKSVGDPGNAMVDAIMSGEWKAALKEGGRTAAELGVGGASTILLGPLALPIAGAENMLRRAAGQTGRQDALRSYMATVRMVGRLMLAADAMNSAVATSGRQMMMKRALLLEDPSLTEAQAEQKMKEIFEGGAKDTKEFALRAAESEAARGDFGPKGTKSHDIAKARRVEQLIEEQTYGPEVLETARDFAAMATFNGEATGAVGALMMTIFGGANRILGLGAKPFNPFPRTVSNLLNNALNYMPVVGQLRAEGLNLSQALFDEKSKYYKAAPERGSAEYFAQHSRAAFGTAAMAIIALMLRQSWEERKRGGVPFFEVSANGPTDINKRRQWQAAGGKPFTVRAGNIVLRYTDWPAMNIVLGALGTVYDEYAFGDDEADPIDRMFGVASSIVGVTLNRNMLGGASALFDILSSGTTLQAKQAAAKKLASSYVGGFTKPALTRYLETIATGTYPDSRSMAGFMASQIPLMGPLRDKPSLNILGEPVEITPMDATVGRLVSTEKTHPILTPLSNADLWIRPPQRYRLFDETKETGSRVMTDAEFYRYTEFYGREMTARLNQAQVNALTQLAKTNPQLAQDRLDQIATYSRNAAQTLMQLRKAKRK